MSFFPSLLYCIPKGIDIISGLPVKRLTRCEYAGKKRVQWLSSLHISQGEASTHSHSQTRPQRIYTYSNPGPSKSIPLFKSRPLRIYTSIQIQAQANPYLYSNPGPSESMPVKSRTQQIRIFSNPGLSESIPI